MHILFFTEKAVKYSKYDPRPRTKCHLRLQKTEPRPRLPFQRQTQSPPGMCAIFAWDVRHLRLVSARSRAKTEPIIARDGAHPGRRQF